ncbi:MAG: ATPase domain-containing protein [Candidatus Bathyarchaeia archaeon]|nr:ATPase domain-containing protein [Candidatus Bathyarchaeota archaeon]MDI9577648.1 ATPase domain-containing protein [Thermoproteota archaeon]MDT8781419.1 AAA family ATPase [Candidatus Bathyarchaeota archaeon]NLD65425.1 AAA family ATPase [Thermoproteota archaeon]
MAQIPTRCSCIDDCIGGGIKPQTITLIYGEPETGKTTLAMQLAVNCAIENKKVLFIDCDNTFSAKRLSQISGVFFDAIADRIVLVKPKNFQEQTFLIDNIQEYITNVGLMVIDTFTSLYSVKTAESKSITFEANRELNRQLALLAQTTKITKIPLVITSQVRSVISEQLSSVRPVATRVLKFWADNILSIKPTEYPNTLKVTVEKVQQFEQRCICYIQICESGIKDTQIH